MKKGAPCERLFLLYWRKLGAAAGVDLQPGYTSSTDSHALPLRLLSMFRYERPASQQPRPHSPKPSWPAASHSTECDRNGANTPDTSAPSRVTANDWQDATMPRMVGNRSSTISVA